MFQESSSRLSLLEQFNLPKTFQFDKESVKVVDVTPANLKTQTPLFICPGWAAGPNVYKENILALAEKGRRVLAVYNYHGFDAQKNATLPDVELRKATLIAKVLEASQIDQVDAVGHSEAGLYLTIAASLFPEKFRNIVLVNPAGMIGKDNLTGLTLRFSADIIKEVINSLKQSHHRLPIIKSFVDAFKGIIASPTKAAQQGVAMSGSQINEQLAALKKQGIGISIIHAANDKVFPINKVQQQSKLDQLHGFYAVVGTHTTLYLEAQKMSTLVDEALTGLTKRSPDFDSKVAKLLT